MIKNLDVRDGQKVVKFRTFNVLINGQVGIAHDYFSPTARSYVTIVELNNRYTVRLADLSMVGGFRGLTKFLKAEQALIFADFSLKVGRPTTQVNQAFGYLDAVMTFLQYNYAENVKYEPLYQWFLNVFGEFLVIESSDKIKPEEIISPDGKMHIRKIKINGTSYFNAHDISDLLDYEEDAPVISKCNEDEVFEFETLPKNYYLCDAHSHWLTKSGMYHAILASSKTRAIGFKKWVTEEILPDIASQGVYVNSKVIPELDSEKLGQIIREEMTKANAGINAQLAAISGQIALLTPKAEITDDIINSGGFDLNTVKKLLWNYSIDEFKANYHAWVGDISYILVGMHLIDVKRHYTKNNAIVYIANESAENKGLVMNRFNGKNKDVPTSVRFTQAGVQYIKNVISMCNYTELMMYLQRGKASYN